LDSTLERVAVDCALYAKDSGYVLHVDADIGHYVKAGQVLAVIDDPELQMQFVRAEVAVQQASAALEVAKRRLVGMQAAFHLFLRRGRPVLTPSRSRSKRRHVRSWRKQQATVQQVSRF
jgi:multidrug resistance efflux pump